MSQHPSLRSSEKDKQHRSVLKRHERIRLLKDKEKWKEEDSVFGLPKVKVVRFKIKKEKVAKEPEGVEGVGPVAGAEAATPPTGQPKATSAKESAKPQAQQAEGKKEAK